MCIKRGQHTCTARHRRPGRCEPSSSSSSSIWRQGMVRAAAMQLLRPASVAVRPTQARRAARTG